MFVSIETDALFLQQSPMILVSIVTAVFSRPYHVHGENDENSRQSPGIRLGASEQIIPTKIKMKLMSITIQNELSTDNDDDDDDDVDNDESSGSSVLRCLSMTRCTLH